MKRQDRQTDRYLIHRDMYSFTNTVALMIYLGSPYGQLSRLSEDVHK